MCIYIYIFKHNIYIYIKCFYLGYLSNCISIVNIITTRTMKSSYNRRYDNWLLAQDYVNTCIYYYMLFCQEHYHKLSVINLTILEQCIVHFLDYRLSI